MIRNKLLFFSLFENALLLATAVVILVLLVKKRAESAAFGSNNKQQIYVFELVSLNWANNQIGETWIAKLCKKSF